MKFTKESLNRALRTFLQAFLGMLAVNITYLSTMDWELDTKTIITTICSQILGPALSAGIAAVMNMQKKELEDNEEVSEESKVDTAPETKDGDVEEITEVTPNDPETTEEEVISEDREVSNEPSEDEEVYG